MAEEHVEKTLNLVVAQVEELERQVADKKRTANDLCRLLQQPPMFGDVESVNSSMATRPDEFYGREMPEVIRTVLEKRKRANLGAATVSELYDAIVKGGFHFQTTNAAYAKRGIYSVLASNDGFHKLPDGRYGLIIWYPAARSAGIPNGIGAKGKRKRGRPRRIPGGSAEVKNGGSETD